MSSNRPQRVALSTLGILLLLLSACATGRKETQELANTPEAPVYELPQLKALPDKFVGNVLPSGWRDDPRFHGLWNQISTENAAKWGAVEARRDVMQWGALDGAYNFAKSNGYPLKFHTLIWGQQQPEWINTLPAEEQAAEIEEWFSLIADRHPDPDMIDVVNEPLHSLPAYIRGLGGPGQTGFDWIIRSFELARQYFPGAELHINDYNILNSEESTGRYIRIIQILQERGLVDGIGLQGHFLEDTDSQLISQNLDRLAELGLPLYITEFDLNISDDARQTRKLSEIFPLFAEHPAVKGITFWGYLEGRVWRERAFLVRRSGEPRPALLWLASYLAGENRTWDEFL